MPEQVIIQEIEETIVTIVEETSGIIELVSTGPQGPSGTLAIGTITTLPTNQPAAVRNVGTPTNAIWDLDIPKGETGDITEELQAAADAAVAAASAASDSEDAAESAATTATTKASEASASASSALAAKVAAETVLDQTLAAFDNFDDRYLGPKAIDPTVDNDGNALVGGSLYFNTNPVESGGGMKVYDGSVWRTAYASFSGALIASNNLSDIASASAARINLALGNVENKSSATIRGELSSSNVMAALGFTPYDAANPDDFIDASALTPFLTSSEAATTYQPIDADLTAIAALTGTTGLLKKTAANTWALDTAAYEIATNKNVVNGYAGLDSSGLIPSSLLPSFVDDVIEATNFAALPATGTSGKIYVALDTGKIFRWSGSAYAEISASPGSTDAVTEGSVNLYFTTARARASISAAQNITYNSTTGVLTGPNLSSYLTSATAASTYLPKVGGTITGNLTVNTGADSRVLLQSSGTTQGQFQVTGTAVRLASNGTLPLYLSQNGVDLLDITTTAIVGNRQFRVPNSASYLYAFVGEQTAGAGKYNLYMSGTAANYLGGALDVVGAITQNGSQVLHAGNYSSYAAAASHTHSYLPLSGGTLTGAITFAAAQTWPTFNQNTTGSAGSVAWANVSGKPAFFGDATATWVSPGRVVNTWYQNTTGRALAVYIWADSGTLSLSPAVGGAGSVYPWTDFDGSTGRMSIVPNGWSYQLVSVGFDSWREM